MTFDAIASIIEGIDPEGPFLLLTPVESLSVRFAYAGMEWTFRGYHRGQLLYRPDFGA